MRSPLNIKNKKNKWNRDQSLIFWKEKVVGIGSSKLSRKNQVYCSGVWFLVFLLSLDFPEAFFFRTPGLHPCKCASFVNFKSVGAINSDSICHCCCILYICWPHLFLSEGGLCDGDHWASSRVSSARHLLDLHRPTYHPVDALRLLAGLRQRKQGQHRLSTPAQLVCADC